jgi:hypothetical protein
MRARTHARTPSLCYTHPHCARHPGSGGGGGDGVGVGPGGVGVGDAGAGAVPNAPDRRPMSRPAVQKCRGNKAMCKRARTVASRGVVLDQVQHWP